MTEIDGCVGGKRRLISSAQPGEKSYRSGSVLRTVNPVVRSHEKSITCTVGAKRRFNRTGEKLSVVD